MTSPTYLDFTSPYVEVAFVKNGFIWSDIFTKPFPIDRFNKGVGSVILSHYFYTKKMNFRTKAGFKERQCIIANKEFYLAYPKSKVDALVALCEFLTQFNLRVRNFTFQVKKHDEVPFDTELSTFSVYYKKPVLPLIDKKKGVLFINLEQNLFSKICHYQNGKITEVPAKPQVVMFPCSTFSGLSLHT